MARGALTLSGRTGKRKQFTRNTLSDFAEGDKVLRTTLSNVAEGDKILRTTLSAFAEGDKVLRTTLSTVAEGDKVLRTLFSLSLRVIGVKAVKGVGVCKIQGGFGCGGGEC